MLALHGWPQHHWAYRDLLADPPPGLRIIAPDLPGYGWSGPAPHKWAKDDVAADVLALMDAMGLDRVLLVGHDWGGFVGYRMVLEKPERFDGYLVINMAHPWVTPGILLPQFWRLLAYQPFMATIGVWLQQSTPYVEKVIYGVGPREHRLDPDVRRVYSERFRDPVVARTGRDTYRTFLVREIPAAARHPETRRATVPIRALFGTADFAVHRSLADPETANADDYTFEPVDARALRRRRESGPGAGEADRPRRRNQARPLAVPFPPRVPPASSPLPPRADAKCPQSAGLRAFCVCSREGEWGSGRGDHRQQVGAHEFACVLEVLELDAGVWRDEERQRQAGLELGGGAQLALLGGRRGGLAVDVGPQ